MLLSTFLSLLLVGGVAVAKPDVAGTRTVVISLATGESGQIIPYVLHRNSYGFDPITISSYEEQTSSAESPDTSVDSTSSEAVSTPDSNSSKASSAAEGLSEESSSTAEPSLEATAEESTLESSAVEHQSTDGGDFGSDSDSDSDSEESKKSVAAISASNSSHTSKKSGASAHALPNAAVFFAIPACLCAVSLNRAVF
ncbi:hypothetical protein GGI20_003497 [Coemansia sp. BCRC 34301]|nr:hypothetical protein GGI20_003497 [Coemansia sp. BCRC 34301]